jgi:hypothetical protein
MVLRVPLVFAHGFVEHLVLAHGFVFAHGFHPWFHEAPHLYKRVLKGLKRVMEGNRDECQSNKGHGVKGVSKRDYFLMY